jgi:hypothetical protein
MLHIENGVARIRSEVSISRIVQQIPLDESPLQSPSAVTLRADLERSR